jgi:hypothetical protein
VKVLVEFIAVLLPALTVITVLTVTAISDWVNNKEAL